MIELNNLVTKNENSPDARKISELLYDAASLRSGYAVKNTEDFADKIFELVNSKLKKEDHKKDEL